MSNMKIKITKNGPYIVTGGIPLGELIIKETEEGNIYEQGKTFPLQEEYALCRCGKSKNKPFCDRSHKLFNFDGTLTAPLEIPDNKKTKYYGKNIILEDAEELCAYARFCHSSEGDVWNSTENADNKQTEDLAIKLACDCPSGRLVMKHKETNEEIEPKFEPSIMILQDPAQGCSGPLFVRGGITIEDEDGNIFEVRNRVTLCRCGASKNKPFCDATHINIKFNDKI